jgi:PAS domain S-box-containing protein
MSPLLVISLVIRILAIVWAMVWSVIVLRRLKDWRIGFLTAFLALTALREASTLLGTEEFRIVSVVSGAAEQPGIVLSIALFVAVPLLARTLIARHQAEALLRDSEDRYRDLVEHSHDLICTHDLDGRILSINPFAAKVLGYEPDELLKLTVRDVLAPEVAHEFDEYIATMRREGAAEGLMLVKTVSGERRLWEYRNTLRTEGVPAPVVRGIAHDITEKKRMDNALRAAKARTESVLASVADVHILFDREWHYIYVNQAAVEAMGRPREQILGQTLLDLYPDINGTELERDYRRAMTERVAVASDSYYETTDTWWSNRFFPSPEGLAVFATDVTERKRAEENLAKQKEILQAIFDHVPIMLSFIGADDQIKFVNREWERTIGWSLEEINKQRLDIFNEAYPDPEDRQRVLKFVAESNGEWSDFKTTVRSGQVLDTTWARVPLSDGTSVGIGQDITERKRVEEMLRRQTAELAALHEIGLEICAEKDLSKVLHRVTSSAAGLLNAYHCSTYILNREECQLRLVASLEPGLIGRHLRLGEGLAGRVAITGNVEAIESYSKWKGRAAIFETNQFGPALAAPLKWQQTVIGAISLGRKQGEPTFTRDDSRLLEQMAAVAAIAIQQASLFEEVREGQKRLRTLSHKILDVQEAERKRIARELHDQIGQALTAIQISLHGLHSSSDNGSNSAIEDSLAVIDEALEQVHSLSLDLRPSLLDDLGLVAALRWYVDRLASRTGLTSSFDADPSDIRLNPGIETACFRIAQEALTNILRHANARRVWVRIGQLRSGFKLSVKDDGVGFDVRAAMKRKGANASLGLRGMQERAIAAGGVVDIKSTEGNGTLVEVIFMSQG